MSPSVGLVFPVPCRVDGTVIGALTESEWFYSWVTQLPTGGVVLLRFL